MFIKGRLCDFYSKHTAGIADYRPSPGPTVRCGSGGGVSWTPSPFLGFWSTMKAF